jgi:hypothetical protein
MYINNPSQLDNLQYQYWTGSSGNNFNAGYSVNFQLDGKDFTFIPTDVINKGFVADNKQYYFSDLLKKDNFNTLKEKGQTVDLSGVSWYGDFLKNTMGRDSTGVLIPTEEANKIISTPKEYEIGSTYGKKDNIPKTAITGLAQTKKGDYVYQNEIPEGKYPVGGTKWAYNYIDSTGTIKSGAKAAPKSSGGFFGKIAKAADVIAPIALAFVPAIGPALSAGYSAGSTLGKGGDLGDALKSGAISYGASTLGAEIGGQLGGAESTTDFLGSQALGDATTGAVGTGSTGFGLNPNAAGFGINQGTGSLLGGTTSQVFDDGSTLLSDSSGRPIGGTDSTNRPFSVVDGVGQYEDGSLLGGTPETTFGGQLADPKDVQSLLDYNAGLATAGGLSASDVLQGTQLVSALTAQPQQPEQQAPQSIVPRGSVSYDPLLSLLTMRASTPNLLSLLG